MKHGLETELFECLVVRVGVGRKHGHLDRQHRLECVSGFVRGDDQNLRRPIPKITEDCRKDHLGQEFGLIHRRKMHPGGGFQEFAGDIN